MTVVKICSIYAKEIRTTTNVIYTNVELIYDAPVHIKELISDAITIQSDDVLEYVSKRHIVSIEMYKEVTQ